MPFTSSARGKLTLNPRHVRVGDVMHHSIIGVPRGTPMSAVAQLMATQRIHAVTVGDVESGNAPWGIVSALDVVAAEADGDDLPAEEIAATEVVSISADERLDHAGRLMAEHQVSHLIVIDPASGKPIGVLSTLDILAALAGD
jgi:CBS domain-containing protein